MCHALGLDYVRARIHWELGALTGAEDDVE